MSEVQQEIKVGDRMSDGTIYAGISPETHKAMYTTPVDAPLRYSFRQAAKYASKLGSWGHKTDAYGHKDWRVPTPAELTVLWENRDEGALKGTFKENAYKNLSWYWSSQSYINHTSCELNGEALRFFNGMALHNVYADQHLYVRCARG